VSPALAEFMAVWISEPAWITLALAGYDGMKMDRAIARSVKIMIDVFLPENLMPEMAHACEDHGHIVLIGGINHLCIPYRPAGMNYGNGSSLEGLIQAVSEGEE